MMKLDLPENLFSLGDTAVPPYVSVDRIIPVHPPAPVKEDTPVETPVECPVGGPVEEPVEEILVELVEKPAEEPVEEAVKAPVEESVEEPIEEPAEEPVEDLSSNPAFDEPDEEPVEEPAEELCSFWVSFNVLFPKCAAPCCFLFCQERWLRFRSSRAVAQQQHGSSVACLEIVAIVLQGQFCSILFCPVLSIPPVTLAPPLSLTPPSTSLCLFRLSRTHPPFRSLGSAAPDAVNVWW